jgi:hypothetical protein
MVALTVPDTLVMADIWQSLDKRAILLLLTGKLGLCSQSYGYGKPVEISRMSYLISSRPILRQGLITSSFLLDHSQYAVAQKKYVFIYDRDGVELHRLKSHIEPTCLEFLPFHWLLATVVRDLRY